METVTALILLPIEYNPDKKGKRHRIPMKGFQDTAVEISDLFEEYGLGCTIDPYPKHGIWVKLGVIYEDINVILEINSLPMTEKEKLIKYCQENLLKRFNQEAILIKFVPQVQAELVTVKK
jgi:hypothetical protein